MWKIQMISTTLLSITVTPLHIQEPKNQLAFNERMENSDISMYGAEFPRSFAGLTQQQPLVLSFGYGPIRESRPVQRQMKMKGHFVIVQERAPTHRPFYRPGRPAFSRPIFRDYNSGSRFPEWYPPKFPRDLGNGGDFSKIPVTYIVSQPQEFGYDGKLQEAIGNQNLDSTASRIELLKSNSFTLPPEVTVYHPTDYAKKYYLESPTEGATINTNDDDDHELLIGEEKKADLNHDDDFEVMVDGNSGLLAPSQYYQDNRKPLMFDDSRRIGPKNIYEIISAEKLVPGNLEVVENKMNFSWEPAIGSHTQNSSVVEVRAIYEDESSVEETKTDEENIKDMNNTPSSECTDKVNKGGVQNLTEKDSFKKNLNEIQSRLDVVLIGQQICR